MTHAPQLVLGVDTHKDVHVVVLLDRLGRHLAAASFGTTDAANAELVAWTRRYGQVSAAGVEGTGSYGYRLAQHLADQGISVVEVNRPDRARRRRKGKSDPVDAEAAARAVLAGDAHAVPKDRNGAVGELRALVVARRSAIKARTQATNQLRALLVDGDDELRGRLRPLRKAHLARACAQLAPTAGLQLAMGSLGRRWLALNDEITGLDAAITTTLKRTAPRLLSRHSVGVQTAAQLLITAGDNPGRLRSEAAFAAVCGASPVEASSGKTIRHRLNRGGDRAANSALWTIANNRLMHDPRSRAYAAKRTALGNSRKELLRCIKRALARELYPLILDALAPPPLP
ncbi:MAG TPA: IS110 family transposase [Actinomycetes bacterium]